ncbi:MAG: DUF3817 domain-containing protein [Mycobacteriales bacterium]
MRHVGAASAWVGAFRAVAVAEGVAFPVLLVAAVLRPVLPQGALAVAVFGSAHGALFCCYLPLVLLARRPLGWNRRTTLLALGASLLPGGTWWVERHWALIAVAPGGHPTALESAPAHPTSEA